MTYFLAVIRTKCRARIGETETAISPAVTVSTKMADSTAFSVNTVIKWFPITTGVFKLNMVLYFFGDGSRVLA